MCLGKMSNSIECKFKELIERSKDSKILNLELSELEPLEKDELQELSRAFKKEHMLRLGAQNKKIFLNLRKKVPMFAKYSYVVSTFEGDFIVDVEGPLYKFLRNMGNQIQS